ncbi:MAG: WhiB family transcriptional regulator [Acidimicrobiaceae bacterium]|nr:WhiB family transcriptional regulator [Acidimicrobiaceae bacterium]MDP6697098.1 WhiB family transcriptional regulator [Acidimicrobiales bacterium]
MGATADTGTVVVIWHQRGACRGLDASIFFPDPDDDFGADRAKAVCECCEVRESCLEHALSRREPTGVWGGATESERRRMTRRRRRSA